MILAILQARMTSSRLPGKVLKPIMDRPMIGRHIDRLRLSRRIDQLVLATSEEQTDDPIAAFGTSESVRVHRGSLNDVLGRFHSAMAAFSGVDHVVRLTADCPLADPQVIDDCIAMHQEKGGDYTSNILERTYPDGLDVEVMRRDVLETAFRDAKDQFEREHVTPYIYRHPERFSIVHMTQSPDLGLLRWTVDNARDLDMVRAVYAELLPVNPRFGQQDVLDLLAGRPDIAAINAE